MQMALKPAVELSYLDEDTVVVAVITSVRKREDIASHIPLETNCGLKEPSMVMLEQLRN